MAPRSDSAARYSSSRSAPVRSARSRTWPGRLLAGDVQHPGGRLGRHLQQQRRLPHAGLTGQQHHRAGDESAAEHAVQFGHPGRPGPGGVQRDVGDAPRGRGGRARGHPRAGRGGGRGLDERAPRLARRAAPHPLRRPVLAGRAAVGRAGAGGHSPLRPWFSLGLATGTCRVTLARALEGQHDRVGRAHLQVLLEPGEDDLRGGGARRDDAAAGRAAAAAAVAAASDAVAAPGGTRLAPAVGAELPARWRRWLRRRRAGVAWRRRRARAWPALKLPGRASPAPGRSPAASGGGLARSACGFARGKPLDQQHAPAGDRAVPGDLGGLRRGARHVRELVDLATEVDHGHRERRVAARLVDRRGLAVTREGERRLPDGDLADVGAGATHPGRPGCWSG